MSGGDVSSRPDYLGDSRLDDVARMVFELTSELWVLKDRTLIMEQLLAQHGLLEDGAVDQAQPDSELSKKLLEERNALVSRVYGSVLNSDSRVDAALKR